MVVNYYVGQVYIGQQLIENEFINLTNFIDIKKTMFKFVWLTEWVFWDYKAKLNKLLGNDSVAILDLLNTLEKETKQIPNRFRNRWNMQEEACK